MFGHVDVCLKLFLPLSLVGDSFAVGTYVVVVVVTRRHLCHIDVVFVGDTILTLEFLFQMSVPIVLDIVVGPLR